MDLGKISQYIDSITEINGKIYLNATEKVVDLMTEGIELTQDETNERMEEIYKAATIESYEAIKDLVNKISIEAYMSGYTEGSHDCATNATAFMEKIANETNEGDMQSSLRRAIKIIREKEGEIYGEYTKGKALHISGFDL